MITDVQIEAAVDAYTKENRRWTHGEILLPALEAAERAAWRPIEEAPKDGTPVLVSAGAERFVAFRATDIDGSESDWVFARSPSLTHFVRTATHFRPLPAPPEGD